MVSCPLFLFLTRYYLFYLFYLYKSIGEGDKFRRNSGFSLYILAARTNPNRINSDEFAFRFSLKLARIRSCKTRRMRYNKIKGGAAESRRSRIQKDGPQR